ncbi:uncharacterized protein LOC109503585 isoform X2 [Harpegnathos saltator]|uniref:uncharacterized protein LOC109503585 isoform X2 n=1 Tax=Harpegnathos saltator TaxID=610380 RepID=UPI000DBED105|nr:uncharacterized protein LOC109503585 isoform X2 [Harpegnathos saltator]
MAQDELQRRHQGIHGKMFAEKFRKYMRTSRAVPAAHHVKSKPFIHKELENNTHVFVRVDRPRGPLEQPYERPFVVMSKINDSLFRVNYKGQQATINIDRLKPAFMEAAEPQGQGSAEETNPQPGPSTADISCTPKERNRTVKFAT